MKYIIISGSSDIGSAIIDDLIRKGHDIIYTYNSRKVARFKKLLCFKLDISSRKNIQEFTKNKELNNWDNLIVLPGTQNPIGLFNETSGEDWIKSVDINFTNQMYLIREMIPKKSSKKNK
jgi:NADP-dependent 3-hydroxy acid dehydrogenase YdfG|tara:strand:- start:192 stop:551 length:360 start_codon:yes stop_codon:yes gene_type:complete